LFALLLVNFLPDDCRFARLHHRQFHYIPITVGAAYAMKISLALGPTAA
jgi:hypothetical protein